MPEAVWAARVLGKPIVSCEAFTHVSIRHGNLRYDAHRGHFSAKTDPERMWKTTPDLLKSLSNAHFARGVNRIQMHSFSYSPPGIPAPGWRMYAEIHLNRNAPIWPQMKELNTWIARNQFVLQSGVPVADVLVYPVESNPVDGPFNTIPDQPASAINAIDAANAAVLSQVVKRCDDLPDRCRHIIVRGDIPTLAEARNLLELADRGMTIWCCHSMPAQWSSLRDTASSNGKPRATTRKPAADESHVTLGNSNPEPNLISLRTAFQQAVEQGRIRDARQRTWQDVASSVQSVHWTGTGRLSFQHRHVDGAEIYLISSWEQPFQGTVSFPHHDRRPEFWDADNGAASPFERYSVENQRTHIPWQQEKNESRIIVFPGTPT